MTNEDAIKWLENLKQDIGQLRYENLWPYAQAIDEVISLLEEQKSLLGISQTADGIAFISTGTAQEGESRGISLGKKLMHEWLYKELLYKDLLTDEIRSVFEQAESI